MVYHGLSWFIMVYHGLSWFIMVYHGLSWFIMVYHHVQIENLGNLVPSHRLPTSPRGISRGHEGVRFWMIP